MNARSTKRAGARPTGVDVPEPERRQPAAHAKDSEGANSSLGVDGRIGATRSRQAQVPPSVVLVVDPPPMRLHPEKPGTFMSSEEWRRTIAIRRKLVDELGHLKWSRMTARECDEAVRVRAAESPG